MKRLILTVIILLIPAFAFAGPIEEKQLQLNALQWEYNYTTERQKVIQADAQRLAQEIKKLQAEAQAQEAEKVEPK